MSASNERGMTLIELLTVLAILTMLAGLFPLAIQRLIPARQLAAATQSLTLQLRELQSQSAVSGRHLQLTLETLQWTGVEVTLKTDAQSQPIRAVTMYPDGTSSGGIFELRSGSHTASVVVSALTGQVRRAP